MIEGEDAVEKHQHTVGNVQIIRSVLPDVLQAAHNVIRAITDGAGGERRKAFYCGWTVLLQEFFDDFENISHAALDFTAALDLDLGCARFQPQKRPHAEKRVASNLFSAFDRLEQEGIALSVRDGKKGGNRRQQVGGDGLRDWNQRGAARQAQEFFVVGTGHVISIARTGSLSQEFEPLR